MRRMFPCFRLVVVEHIEFAFVLVNAVRRLDQHLNLVYHAQI